MSFFEERFPDDIAQGATGGPRWKTTVVESSGGHRWANKDWSDAVHVFEVSHAIKSLEAFAKVRAFFYVVGGRFDAFRFKDYTNYRVTTATGVLVSIGGSTSNYQLCKAERYGSRSYLRRILKPVANTVRVFRTRSGTTTELYPVIDTTTGAIVLSGHQGGDVYAWSGEFDVPVNFVDDSMETAQMIGPDGGAFMSWPSIQLRENKDSPDVKTLPVALASHYGQRTQTIASFLEVTRRDGVVLGFTSADVDVVVEGRTFIATIGLELSDLSTSADLAVDTLTLTVFPDEDIPEADLLAGLWDFAAFRIFEANYLAPADGINVLRRGWTGELDTKRDGYSFELRSLKQSLQQTIAVVTSKTCRARLGDEDCRVDLTPWTHSHQVSAVASRRQFTVSGWTEPDDYYSEGTARALDGANEGYSQKVKTYAAGVFTLALPMPFPIGVGDHFEFVAGCRKRLEDCRDKFFNTYNFQGEPHVPGTDAMTKDPEVGG